MKRSGRSSALLDLLFPRRCPFCGTVGTRDSLCPKCRDTLPYTGDLQEEDRGFARCAAPLYYEDGVRKAVLDLKFHGKLGGLDCFGELMAQCAARQFAGEFDTVTWVPVSRRRRKQRGFDQAQLLAEAAAGHWQVRPVPTLVKTVDNPAQSSLEGAEKRRANVLGVYEPVGENICGHRILLIDDVLTTGATLAECVRVLREAGAAEVLCLTLARVRA